VTQCRCSQGCRGRWPWCQLAAGLVRSE
jgi:hypothetical protein